MTTFSNKLTEAIGPNRQEIARSCKIPKNRIDSFCKGIETPKPFQVCLLSHALNIDSEIMESWIDTDDSSIFQPISFNGTTIKPELKKVDKPGVKVKSVEKVKRLKFSKTVEIEPPKERYCRRCERETGTECYRHDESRRKSKFGKGYGKKVKHRRSAWLCNDCDAVMSPDLPKTATENEQLRRDLEWSDLAYDSHVPAA
jgi:hypothetical protein